MPALTPYYRTVMKLRRYPVLHRPLKFLFRLVVDKIPILFIEVIRPLAPRGWLRFGPPKGSFSIYASRIYEGRRPRRVVLTDQGAPATTADSLQVLSGFAQHSCQPWPVFWSHHSQARLVTSTLVQLDDRKEICRDAAYGDMVMEDDPAWRYLWLPKPVALPGNWTSLVSRWVPNDSVPTFTHWILDALPRLALLPEFPPDTGILIPSRLAGYQKETLALLGLTDRCRYTSEKHLVVENYYFSSPTAMIDCYNPYGIDFLRSQFLPKADPNYSGPKKIVLHRSNKSRGIQNQDEIYQLFTELGWAIVDTEKLTFAQEIKLFQEAEAVAGVFGSGFTNTIWCSKGCKVITFVPDSFVDGYIEWIADYLGLPFYFSIFPSDHESRALVDLEKVKSMLRAAELYPS